MIIPDRGSLVDECRVDERKQSSDADRAGGKRVPRWFRGGPFDDKVFTVEESDF
jgi:hypothetical protein